MADWVLIPCLKTLFAEFDRIAPNRDHASDGSKGDDAHSKESSDHNPDETGKVPIHDADGVNEVHAIDVDNDLNRPDLGSDPMEKIIQFLLGECRKDESVGTDRGRLRYIIYRRRTWDYRTGWAEEPYTGASPHDEHAHFSADYDSAKEADTRPWGIVDKFGDDVSEEDVTNALNKFFTRTDMPDPALPGAATSKTGLDVWYHGIPNGEGQQEKAYQVVNLMAQRIVQLVSMVSELAGRDLADEAAIAQAILAGLTPAAMTDAMIVALQAIPAETAKEVLDAIRQALATAAK